ncbi:MAG: NAD(P)/FAD-dependent oxidoreductase [Actinobacteria bacterium]|nr:NAD(P)/FAD-dependent oxidoreductase [Actinomycetota bacterium]
MSEHDLIVVGLGPGGEEVAKQAAEAGLNVLGIDHRLVGGECPYWGCVPSKVMARAGNSLAEAARAIGLAGDGEMTPAWPKLAGRVREVTGDWDDAVAVRRHVDRGETFVRGTATLTAPREVEVDGERYRSRRGVVIATGGVPAVPPIPGLADVEHWTSREAIEAANNPHSMVVLGGGAVGVELAQAYGRFGTEVTIVERDPHLLSLEEPEQGEELAKALAAEGIALRTGVGATEVAADGPGVLVSLSDGSSVSGERLLVATGRRVDLGPLGVAAMGIDPSGHAIPVDERLRAGDGLWAVGDVTGVAAFTHVAVYQGRIAAADILQRPHTPADYRAVPRVTFTDPEVASVGLSERDARERGIDVRIGLARTAESSRGYIHGPGAEFGVTKVVADAARGVLVGASTMGPAAGELLGILLLAVQAQIPVSGLRDLIYPYPTFLRGIEPAIQQVSEAGSG